MGNGDVKPVDRCGAPGQPCAKPSDYAVVNPHNPPDGVHLDRILVEMRPYGEPAFTSYPPDTMLPVGVMDPYYKDNPDTPERKEKNELDKLVNGDWFAQRGYDLLYRSVSEPFSFYGQKSMAHFLTFDNEISKEDALLAGLEGMSIHAKEMMGLASCAKLGLSTIDVMIKPDAAPKNKNDFGTYYFTRDESRLNEMIAVLRDFSIAIADVTMQRREDVAAHLEKVIYDLPENKAMREQGGMMWDQFVGMFVMQAIFTVPLLLIFYKQLGMGKEQMVMMKESMEMQRKMMEGDSDKNKLDKFASDLVEGQRAKLAENILVNEIMGRDEEALEYLRRVARPEYANPLIVAEPGVGKKEIVNRAAQLIALKDPRIPEPFKDGRIKGIYTVDASAFGGGTGIRGDVGARVSQLVDAMKRGYAIHFEEMADFLSSGSTGHGESSESLGSLIKQHLTEKYSRWTGDTNERNYKERILQHKLFRDLNRRMPPMRPGDIPVPVVEKIIVEKTVPFYTDWYGDVVVDHDAAKLATNVAISNLDADAHHRVDAAKQLLMDTIEYAISERRNGEVKITVEDVLDVAETQTGIRPESNFEYIDNSVDFDADKLAKEVSHGKAIMEALEGDAWFAGLGEDAKRGAMREAVLVLTGAGGERFREADGSIKGSDLAREVRGSMKRMSAGVAAGDSVMRGSLGAKDSERREDERIILEAIERDLNDPSFRDAVPETKERVAELCYEHLMKVKEEGRLHEYVRKTLRGRLVLKRGAGRRIFEESAARFHNDQVWSRMRGVIDPADVDARRREIERREIERREGIRLSSRRGLFGK